MGIKLLKVRRGFLDEKKNSIERLTDSPHINQKTGANAPTIEPKGLSRGTNYSTLLVAPKNENPSKRQSLGLSITHKATDGNGAGKTRK